MKNYLSKILILILISGNSFYYAQSNKVSEKKYETEEEEEDIRYEIKHKSLPWFKKMKDGEDYLKVKSKYDKYFGRHRWEKSKPRNLSENWIKTKLFYLDEKGKVVPEPLLLDRPKIKNIPLLTTQTVVGDWTMIGPVNSASTGYSSKYNHGGYVYLTRIDPTDPQKIFVSFLTGGLWRSIDGGTDWTLVDSGFSDSKYLDIDICQANPQVVYALSDSQLIKSTDGGLNWVATSMSKPTYTGTAYEFAVSPTDPNIVVVRWGTLLYRTTNGGTTWTTVLTGLPNYDLWAGDSSVMSDCLEWDPQDDNAVYFSTSSNNNIFRVYKSSDKGASFTQLSSTTLPATANGQTVGWTKVFLPTNNTSSFYVAVGTGSSAYAHGAVQLYKFNKSDGATATSFPKINMIPGTGGINSLHHGDIQIDRVDENKIVYGTYGQDNVMVSTDNGTTFLESTDITHADIRSIDLVNGKLLIGSDGELALSNDLGATITTLTNSISNHELWGFGSAFKSNVVASGNNHGPVMIKENANGFDWYNGTGADQGNTDVNPLDDRYIYSQGYDNYRYFRTGVHTLINEDNFLDAGGIYAYFNSMEFHPNKYYTLITHHAGQYPTGNANLATWKNSLIKTENNGDNISIVKTFNNQVFREKISMKNPKNMIVVEGLTTNKLWKTIDEGVTWTDITPGTTVTSGPKNISDIAIGDEDPNEIWVTYSGVQSVCKVLKSNDGGITWTNLTSSVLTTSPITKIVFQRGSDGGVYVGNKAGIFYRNDTMSNWVMLGNGLPMCDVRFMFINYNENKLKIGTSRGAFEHNLYEISPPNALISVNTNKIACPAVNQMLFKDYSVVRNASATWQWSFPGGTPSTSTAENPTVSYAGAANGFYDVSLTVTDQYGTSTQTLTDFIEINNQCGTSDPDKVPGNAVSLTGQTNGDYVNIDNLNLNRNSFTFSCWIKPTGIQPDFSGIFMSQGNTNAFGMNFMGGNNTIGFHPTFGFSSGLQAPAGQWSHVALVSNGTNVKIYVNGVERTSNTVLSSEVFNAIFLGKYGRGRSDRFTTLEMDEVAIWNRPLTIDEIRKWRHLTKSIAGESILTGLVYYLQFDETAAAGDITLNKNNTNTYATYKGTGYTRVTSNVPVFEGVSEKMNINSSGLKDFTTAGIAMQFATGTYPNGDVWVSRGTINPDQVPNTDPNFGFYSIVNNYGANQTFTPLTSLSFYNNASFGNNLNASAYKLFKRADNAFGNTWGASIDNADNISGSGLNTKVTFNTDLNVTSSGQLELTYSMISCYRPRATGTSLDTQFGISSLGRAGTNNGNWPMVRKGAWVALESKTKGFVVNRLTTTQKNALVPVEGMLVYDKDLDCLSIYNGSAWKCLNVQTCPD
ncbi:LamG-like jellyroll fold domain-containing protein [Chryseobacterium sp. KCF3-3]|uniref:LamG-like jellyroll fold domain-containing protein n=1 Tax=Chryseobacterium sp. KCF3-3 TaxID=3231511 RepID=UPI0038B2897A